MPTTSTEVSRLKLLHPDLGHDGGMGLWNKVHDIYEKLGNSAPIQWSGSVTLADDAETDFVHNLGMELQNIDVLIFEANVQISGADLLNYEVTPKTGNVLNEITVKNVSGGSKTFFFYVVGFKLGLSSQEFQETSPVFTTELFQPKTINITVLNLEDTITLNTWATEGYTLSVARRDHGGLGTKNAGCFMGGTNGANLISSEICNGFRYLSVGNLSTARRELAAVGSVDSGLAFGGRTTDPVTITEKREGIFSSWSVTGALATARARLGGTGKKNAALSFGGENSIGTAQTTTEFFRGTAWSAGPAMVTARRGCVGAGTQLATIAIGGVNFSNDSEIFNGLFWSALSHDSNFSSGAAGTLNAAIFFGGNDSYVNLSRVEKFNGFSFITVASLSVAKTSLAGNGTQNIATAVGGFTSTYLNASETFLGEVFYKPYTRILGTENVTDIGGNNNTFCQENAIVEVSIIQENYNNEFETKDLLEIDRLNDTNSFWTTSGNLLHGRRGLAGAGVQNTALAYGGYDGISYISSVEKFNGATWAAATAMSAARAYLAGAGSTLAAAAFGGENGGIATSATELYNGTSWSASGSLLQSRFHLCGVGAQKAALSFGGFDENFTTYNNTEKFNGVTWTATGALLEQKKKGTGVGRQNAAIIAGGDMGIAVEKFNGSSWSKLADLLYQIESFAGSGVHNSALVFGGYWYSLKYNSIVWSLVTGIAQENSDITSMGSCGTANAALGFGGESSDNVNKTFKLSNNFNAFISIRIAI
jgi:hypothetical protein